MARYGRVMRDLRRTGRVPGWHRGKQTYKRERSGERRSASRRTAVKYHKRGDKPRDRATGGGSGPGKAAGEGGRSERENQMSKGEEVDQFHE